MPHDSTPHGGEVMHQPPGSSKFPEPKPGTEEGRDAPDLSQRPALPDHPEQMAVDIEDEEADPVIDRGPGIADGVKSLKRQQG